MNRFQKSFDLKEIAYSRLSAIVNNYVESDDIRVLQSLLKCGIRPFYVGKMSKLYPTKDRLDLFVFHYTGKSAIKRGEFLIVDSGISLKDLGNYAVKEGITGRTRGKSEQQRRLSRSNDRGSPAFSLGDRRKGRVPSLRKRRVEYRLSALGDSGEERLYLQGGFSHSPRDAFFSLYEEKRSVRLSSSSSSADLVAGFDFQKPRSD